MKTFNETMDTILFTYQYGNMSSWRKRRRLASLTWMILLSMSWIALVQGQMSPLVLEEVIEHGPLFDELEDEAWWSGVDIVDTALRPVDLPLAETMENRDREALEDEFCAIFSSDISLPCSVVKSTEQSPSLPRLPPPPPVPPFLADIVQQLNERNGNNHDECLLCQWAALNGTVDLLPSTEPNTENTWIPMLVVVALVSAMLGATLMIAALKCRRFKVLPRGGSCPTLPVGYMVGEGKDGTQNSELTTMDSISKTLNSNPDSTTSSLGRPRLDTPTLNTETPPTLAKHTGQVSTGWRVRLWRKMTGRSAAQILDDYRIREEPYVALPGETDAVSAVYAELNSITGSVHRPLDNLATYQPYHLNTYSEIREPRTGLAPQAAAPSLHLRRLLSDGTYENAAYALERGVVLLEHDSSSGCASTPSSAYYSDLSNSDRSGSQHQGWNRARKRNNSESQGSSQSLPHCRHGRHDIRARDLMPVALEVIPDNQQVPCDLPFNGICCHSTAFSRGGVSASLNASKRPLPPLPSRQLQRPQRRYAYAVHHVDTIHPIDQDHFNHASHSQVMSPDHSMACVPSEYV